jgi:hypothetical protein
MQLASFVVSWSCKGGVKEGMATNIYSNMANCRSVVRQPNVFRLVVIAIVCRLVWWRYVVINDESSSNVDMDGAWPDNGAVD